ncbi:MAG: 3-phosphoshikimate 1-carboxyvinyltransferase [Methylotenera sp.]|nr:3-phosphoshikimate 1-carboxyvinyltransferase [Methylotenera sp.]
MEQLTLPAASQAQGSITLPGSKSISNRTLLLAALADGITEIHDLLDSDDTSRMLESLAILGVSCENVATNTWRVTGCKSNFPNKNAKLFLGNAGTAFRPLTAALAFSEGHYYLSGVPRMHERPIGDLVNALRQAGADIEYVANDGFPPLIISPATLDLSKPIQIRGDVSSQFLTALLMALPLTGKKATVEVIGELISKPYIEITLNLMAKFGVNVQREGWQQFTIAANSHYLSPETIFVEGDASSASYFLAAGAIGGDIRVEGLGKNSIQGDVRFADAVELMGGKISYTENQIQSQIAQKIKAIDLDCNHIPDAAMTLAIMALFAQGNSDQERTTTLRNIASWRVKETDRLTAMATELRKVGATVIEGQDYIKITPPKNLIPNAVIDTYDDHRMAMCFSLVSLGGVPITINDPKCVNKTFPNYFEEFKKLVS